MAEIAHAFDSSGRMRVQTKSAPARVGRTCCSGANHCEGVAMDSLPYPFSLDEAFERNQLALSILEHRDLHADTRALVIGALKGVGIEDLASFDRAMSGDA